MTDAQRAMMGMSSPEWSRYMHDVIGVPDPPDRISEEVVERLAELYQRAASARGRSDRGCPADRRALAARDRLLVEPAADRPLPRAHGDARPVPGDRLFGGGRPRQACAGRLSRSGQPASVGPRIAARRSKTRRTASARRRRPRCPSSRSRTASSHRAQRRLRWPIIVLASLDELTPDAIEEASAARRPAGPGSAPA